MTWPEWIERIRQQYVNDDASVFLLHGALSDATWSIDGKRLPCASTVLEMLSNTRDVIGIWSPDAGLTFPSLQDTSRFERHVEAARLLAGQLRPLDRTDPAQALALIYQAIQTPGLRQGYILRDVHRLAPVGSLEGRWKSLPEDTPGLETWGIDGTLRAGDNILFLLADLEAARDELGSLPGVAVVHVEPPRFDIISELDLDADEGDTFEEPLDPLEAMSGPAEPKPLTPLPDADGAAEPVAEPIAEQPPEPSEPPPTPRRASAPPDPGLVEAVRSAVERALAHRDKAGPFPHRLPMREAVAEILLQQRPDRFGAITWAVEEDQVIGTGRGAVDISRWFDDDIAVQASADMILEGSAGDGPPEAALRAIARRLGRLLDLP